MNSQPNWSQAPADATHWGPDTADWCERWYKQLPNGTWLSNYTDESALDADGQYVWEEVENPDRTNRGRELIIRPTSPEHENDVENW